MYFMYSHVVSIYSICIMYSKSRNEIVSSKCKRQCYNFTSISIFNYSASYINILALVPSSCLRKCFNIIFIFNLYIIFMSADRLKCLHSKALVTVI